MAGRGWTGHVPSAHPTRTTIGFGTCMDLKFFWSEVWWVRLVMLFNQCSVCEATAEIEFSAF